MFLVEETPTKVVSLLSAALASLALLFMVTATNASFTGTLSQVSDPFGPQKVVSVLDNTAASYSHFLAINLFNPVKSDYAMASDNLAWIGSNATDGLAMALNIQPKQPGQPQVAGAYTSKLSAPADQPQDVLSGLYSLLIR